MNSQGYHSQFMSKSSHEINQNSQLSESNFENTYGKEESAYSSINSSQNSCILPSQIENIIKVKPTFAKKVMPKIENQVPNFSMSVKQKLEQFQQAFSREIPTVEQAKNEFKKPTIPVKMKKKFGRADMMGQMLKRKYSTEDVVSSQTGEYYFCPNFLTQLDILIPVHCCLIYKSKKTPLQPLENHFGFFSCIFFHLGF